MFLLTDACTSVRHVTLEALPAPPCATAAADVQWIGPADRADRARLSAWCASVGPVETLAAAPSAVDVARDGLIVVSWNIHEGHGDVARFVARLQAAHPRAAIVALLQEAARASDRIPSTYPADVRPPDRIGPVGPQADLASTAARLRMALAYVPSMRNGAGREDRGAAILSTLPLADVAAVELPWVHQRRVAVIATVEALADGSPWRLRAISVHLDNRPRRSMQAAALAAFASRLAAEPLVIGGDLNAWSGARDRTVHELGAIAPRVDACGNAPTFRFGLRLDHFFSTLPRELQRGCEVERDTFGSDHHPVVLHLFQR